MMRMQAALDRSPVTELPGESTVHDRATGEVVVTRSGRLGRITLNRPRAINALTSEMIATVEGALDEFASRPDVTTVLIDGDGERGLSAGGDMRRIYEAIGADDDPLRFFRDEYRMDQRILRFPKTVVAFMDGIVMGGGVGISAHADIRIVTERTAVAMPEVAIGFAPDVGATWLLARAPGETGVHAALTTARLSGSDALFAGFADLFVESATLNSLAEALTEQEASAVAAEAQRATGPTPASALASQQTWIDACYDSDDAEQIVDRLRAKPIEQTLEAADEIERKSPTSIKVALRAIRNARQLRSIEECIEMEYRIAATLVGTPDFVEGIRAVLIDKDHQPRWNPPSLAAVSAELVDRCFARGGNELSFAR